jgi:hypothetical protein
VARRVARLRPVIASRAERMVRAIHQSLLRSSPYIQAVPRFNILAKNGQPSLPFGYPTVWAKRNFQVSPRPRRSAKAARSQLWNPAAKPRDAANR